MAMFALPFAIRLLTQSAQSNWSRRIAAFLMTYVGCSFVALALLIPGELIRFIFVPDDRVLGWCLVGLTTCVCAYGIVNAMRFEIRILDVNAPTHVRGRTFVQISDVHVGSRSPRILRDIVRRTNELDPDMVFITGDLIDMHGIVEADLTALADIRAPSYFCIGNHERYVDLEAICERLRRLDIRVLRNESDLAPPLQITGIDDAESREQVATQLPALDAVKDCYQILLYHRPDGIDAASAWGTDLMLTGHTHRGQIFPFYYLVKRKFPNIYGRYESANLTLYVSPGTGTWGPVMRIGSRCEISLIRLL
jgi:predicted MPP superfamily phosphohydrolase